MPGTENKDNLEDIGVGGAGTAVDKFGGPVVDPTKNVLDLVKAESRYQDGMRDALEKYQNAVRDAELKRIDRDSEHRREFSRVESVHVSELAAAESRRVNDLESQRVRYEARIAEDLRVNVKTTSDQLAGQLIKETGALNNQIVTLTTSVANQFTTLTTSLTNQMTTQTAGILTRLADLERFRWETGGKSAVADPALTLAMTQMAKSIAELKDGRATGEGSRAGMTMTVGYVFMVVSILAAVITSIIVKYGFPHAP